MGSSRGMPGNYENNYYPRARARRGDEALVPGMRRTRVRTRSVNDGMEEDEMGTGIRILTERGIIVPCTTTSRRYIRSNQNLAGLPIAIKIQLRCACPRLDEISRQHRSDRKL